MKRYRYKVRIGKGAIMSGVLLAEHKGEALQVLKGEHDRILSLKEDWFSVKGTRQHFSDGERERLFKELGILLKSDSHLASLGHHGTAGKCESSLPLSANRRGTEEGKILIEGPFAVRTGDWGLGSSPFGSGRKKRQDLRFVSASI